MEQIIKISRYKIINTDRLFIINYSWKGTITEIIIMLIILLIWTIVFNNSWKSILELSIVSEPLYFFSYIIPIFSIILYLVIKICKTTTGGYFRFDKTSNLFLRNKRVITKLTNINNVIIDEIDAGIGPPVYVMKLCLHNNDEILIDKNSSFNDISILCKKLNIFLGI